MKSHVLFLKHLKKSPNKMYNKIMDLHYVRMNSDNNKFLNRMYDSTIDTQVVQMYLKHIDLTSNKSSLIIQNLSLNEEDEHKNKKKEYTKTYVHVGMCVLSVLKKYIYELIRAPETPVHELYSETIRLFDSWVREKHELFERYNSSENTFVKSIDKAYESYVKRHPNRCRFVMYEHIPENMTTPFFYDFRATTNSVYTEQYKKLEIKYNGPCNSNAHTERYVLDNKLSDIHLHGDDSDLFVQNNDMVRLLQQPLKNISIQWIIYCTTKSKRIVVNDLIRKVRHEVEKNSQHRNTKIYASYDDDSVVLNDDTIQSSNSFRFVFSWNKKIQFESSLFVCILTHYSKFDDNVRANKTPNKTRSMHDSFVSHSVRSYKGIAQLIDPCSSRFDSFDVPKDVPLSPFGVRCDLNTRTYDYRRVWIVVNGSSMNPYIDTTHLRLLSSMLQMRTVCNVGLLHGTVLKQLNERIHSMENRIITELQNKLKHSLLQCRYNKSVRSVLYNVLGILNTETQRMDNTTIDLIIDKIEKQLNIKTPLGKLFAVLGKTNDTIQQKESSSFHYSFVDSLIERTSE